MDRKTLISEIRRKKSFLCVGLDSDVSKIPNHLFAEKDPVFSFNKAIIDATKDYAVAYKINTAFYESQGLKGLLSMAKTVDYLPKDCFTIADAKRGDIGNTAEQYAKTFFETLPFDSVTVAPYMGKDSVSPFLQTKNKWAIVLALTSNPGSQDFQLQECGTEKLYEKVLKVTASWGSPENLMYVIGATRKDQLERVRTIVPDHFLLIPGVGTQGGDISSVAEAAVNKDIGILVNVSRAIIFAGSNSDFDKQAAKAAQKFQQEMAAFIK
jgi:orotidine-5'-phosphate decarboxylase